MLNNFRKKKSFLFSLTLLSLLHASDVATLTEYRNYGIEQIQKNFDQQLSQVNYWKKYLQNRDTRFGYFESYTDILICDKSKPQLSLYTKDKDNSFILDKEFSAYTGKNRGDKEKEGDLKTPVGVYNLIQKISNVDSFYGPMAFVTSYPNLYDKYKGKSGQGIWIHGVPIDQERDSFTKGCIAIDNQNLESLDQKLDLKKTILIIDEKKEIFTQQKEKYALILSQLFSWRYAWIYNDLSKYLNFYDPMFKRFDGMNIKQFSRYKKRIFSRKEKKSIVFTNINIIPYPNSQNMFTINFKEDYKAKHFAFKGNKVLIVKLVDKKLKIITER